MSKEQEIYKNMKRKGRLYKAYGKYGIRYPALYCSIKEAGYNEEQIHQIILNMIAKGYIRKVKNVNGRVLEGLASNYIIEKWVN
jgi:hypothetical protein